MASFLHRLVQARLISGIFAAARRKTGHEVLAVSLYPK
jgi:hypothetical protein